MKNHPKQRELIDYVRGTSKKSAHVGSHVSSCKTCSARCKRYALLLNASDNSRLDPSPRVELALRAAIRKQDTSGIGSLSLLFLRLRMFLPRPAVLYTVSVFLMGIVMVASGWHIINEKLNVPMHLSYAQGKVYVNDNKISGDIRVRNKSRLRVGKNSLAVLAVNSSLTMNITGESSLMIERIRTESLDTQTEFFFNIKSGQIVSKTGVKRPHVKYFYITPTAKIFAKEADLILNANEDETVLVLKKGSAVVQSLETEEEVKASPDKKYVISSDIEAYDLDDDET